MTHASPNVEYISRRPDDDYIQPMEINRICQRIQSLIGRTNWMVSRSELVGWALKKEDSDKPGLLFEEAVVVVEFRYKTTVEWVVASVRRAFGRTEAESGDWSAGLAVGEMQWIIKLPSRPKLEELVDFLERTNFGYNECRPEYQTVYVGIYAPHREILGIVSRGIPKRVKQKRFALYSTIIGDPPFPKK